MGWGGSLGLRAIPGEGLSSWDKRGSTQSTPAFTIAGSLEGREHS